MSTYNGAAQTPCTATVAGAGGLSLTPTPSYGNNTNAGTATASYTFAGDANHTGSSDSKNFAIGKADPIVTATGGTFAYDAKPHGGSGAALGVLGEALTPVTLGYAVVPGPGSLTSAPVSAGTYSVAARFAGDTNYKAKQSPPAAITINKAAQTMTFGAPSNQTYGQSGLHRLGVRKLASAGQLHGVGQLHGEQRHGPHHGSRELHDYCAPGRRQQLQRRRGLAQPFTIAGRTLTVTATASAGRHNADDERDRDAQRRPPGRGRSDGDLHERGVCR